MESVNSKKIEKQDNEEALSVEGHFESIISYESYIQVESSDVCPAALPSWFDERLFNIGQKYANRELAAFTIAYLYGSVSALMIPTVSKVFMSTKRSSSPCLAFKRYFSSTLLFYCIHMHDFKDPRSKFYRAINVIRHMHSTASKKLLRDCGYGITQRDMALVQLSFIAYILVKPEVLGLKFKNDEREGTNHLWRVIGYLLGIPDSINVCRERASDTEILGKKIMNKVLRPHAESLTPDSVAILKRIFSGFNDIIPLFHRDTILTLIYEGLDIKGMYFVGDIIRYFLGVMIHIYYYLYQRYPIIAWIRYGKNKSKFNLFKN